MATSVSFLSRSPLSPPWRHSSTCFIPPPPLSLSLPLHPKFPTASSSRSKTPVLASAVSSSHGFTGDQGNSRFKLSVLANSIQEIEPLEVGLIQKDVPPTTVDAMKRTISKMLGLLPSDQFKVSIEALWEPLSKLLINSMMTGYTMWNAEYRLCLEKNLLVHEVNVGKQKDESSRHEIEQPVLPNLVVDKSSNSERFSSSERMSEATTAIPDIVDMKPETRKYILNLQSRLLSAKRELREVKRKSAALQMQQFVGEEENELLDYLRSLLPEKVAELSEPTSPELKEMIQSVVHGLLATLSPRMHSRAPEITEGTSTGNLNSGDDADRIDVVENTSLQFQPQISLTRDYLARLLFWCILLGHYLRGLEYRLDLVDLLSLPYVPVTNTSNGDLSA